VNLYIIRHADAGDSSHWSGDDSFRPLTEHGRRQARALGEGFRRQGIALDVVLTSPYVRTRETAEVLFEGLGTRCDVRLSELLASGAMRRNQLARELASVDASSLAIIGHDPDLPEFLGWLVGVEPGKVFLKKGGAAFVQCRSTPAKADGHLGWLITPAWYLNAERTGDPVGEN
jgi:phosphohistidine phosphatase